MVGGAFGLSAKTEMNHNTITKLRPWQPMIVESTIKGLQSGNFLNASGLGSGKTYCACAAAKEMGMNLFVVCRVGMRQTWLDVAVNHFGMSGKNVHTINRELLRIGIHGPGTWNVKGHNPETGKAYVEFKWDMPSNTLLVMDEIHADAGLNSKNSQVLRAAVRQGIKILGLSGTAADDPRKLRAIGYMLGLHEDVNFHEWLAGHGATVDSWDFFSPQLSQSRQGKAHLEARRLDEMEKINQRLVCAGRMIRLPTSAIPGFPKSTVNPMVVDFDNAELIAIYEEMHKELEELRKKGVRGHNALTAQTRARQRAELLQVPMFAEMVQDAIEEGNSVAVFLNFTESIAALGRKLGTTCFYTGQESPEIRETNRLRFQQDKERAILVNAAAGSESIGLQDINGIYPRLGLVSPSFQAVTTNQLLGRLPRDGAKTPSTYWIVFPRGTVLERAYHACKKRTDRYGAFNGDVRFTDEDMTEGLPI